MSIDPEETPELARQKKATYVDDYKRAGGRIRVAFSDRGAGGDRARLPKPSDSVTCTIPRPSQYAHGGGIMVMTPTGRISKYFYGVEYPPRDLRLGLVEASGNKIGTAGR